MQYPKPIFRIDRRPIAKVDCMVIKKTSVGYLGMAPCPDIDGDGVVGGSDRILVINALGQSYLVSPKTDLDMDGTTSQSDLITVTGLNGQTINCSNWDFTSEDIVCNSERMSRGLGTLAGPNGFYNLFNDKLNKLYNIGFRRFVLQCPSGILSHDYLSSNIYNVFDKLQTYSTLTYLTNEKINCAESSLPFDSSNKIDGSFFKGFATQLKNWVSGLDENVEITIEISSDVLYHNGRIDTNSIMKRADRADEETQMRFNPNRVEHLDWLDENFNPFSNYGVDGIAMKGIGLGALSSFDSFKNINHCLWKTQRKEFMCSGVPLINGQLLASEEYSKCKIISPYHDYDNLQPPYTLESIFSGRKMFQYYTEIHAIDSGWNFYEDQGLYNLTYNCGIIPSFQFYYQEQTEVDINLLETTLNRVKNAIEDAERKIRLDEHGKKFFIFSENAGNTANNINRVSSKDG